MTRPPDHPVEWLPELALGGLDDETAEGVRAHLEGCDSCRAEYDQMVRVAELLPLAADLPDETEPGDARARLMERIHSEPRSLDAQRWRRRAWFAPAAAAAAVVLMVGAAAFVAGRETSGDAQAELVERQEAIVVAAAEGALDVSQAENDGTRVRVVRAPVSRASFALVEGLPALPDDKAYQAWFSQDGETFEPSDVFDVSEGGVWLSAGETMSRYVALAFTIEDEGGASAPSQAPFVVVPFDASARAR